MTLGRIVAGGRQVQITAKVARRFTFGRERRYAGLEGQQRTERRSVGGGSPSMLPALGDATSYIRGEQHRDGGHLFHRVRRQLPTRGKHLDD